MLSGPAINRAAIPNWQLTMFSKASLSQSATIPKTALKPGSPSPSALLQPNTHRNASTISYNRARFVSGSIHPSGAVSAELTDERFRMLVSQQSPDSRLVLEWDVDVEGTTSASLIASLEATHDVFDKRNSSQIVHSILMAKEYG